MTKEKYLKAIKIGFFVDLGFFIFMIGFFFLAGRILENSDLFTLIAPVIVVFGLFSIVGGIFTIVYAIKMKLYSYIGFGVGYLLFVPLYFVGLIITALSTWT